MKKTLLLLWLLFLIPQTLFAHATPVGYSPTASRVLMDVPKEVRIRFSERVENGASSIAVYATDGSRVEESKASVASSDPYLLTVPIRFRGSGSYAVSWQVVSRDDGHFTKGAYVFSVGEETTPSAGAAFEIVHTSTLSEATLVASELIGQALLLGALVLFLFFFSLFRASPDAEAAQRFSRRLLDLSIAGCLLIALGSLGHFTLKASELFGVIDSEAIRAYLSTVSGGITAVRFFLGIAAFGIVLSLRKGLPYNAGRRRIIVLLILVGFMAALRAYVSHAAASQFLPGFSIFVNFVHLLFKDLWIGTLAAFVYVLLPIIKDWTVGRQAKALLRMGKIASIALIVGGMTGAYIVWLHLKSLENVLTTHWGMQFLLLLLAAVLLIACRLWSEMSLVPALLRASRGESPEIERPRIEIGGIALIGEAMIGLGVLFFSAILIITTPPVALTARFEAHEVSAGTSVSLEEHPYDQGAMLVTVGGEPVSAFTLWLTNEKEGIGPIVPPFEERFQNGFVFFKSALSPTGSWKVDIAAKRENAYDAVASFPIHVPDDFAPRGSEARTFDQFTAAAIFFGILSVLFGGLLFYTASVRSRRIGEASISIQELMASRPWLSMALPVSGLVVIALMMSSSAHGGFQNACVRSGGMWHESVPMRAGRIVSERSAYGCMVGSGAGQYHFADVREFAEFLRTELMTASIELHVTKLMPRREETVTVSLHDLRGGPAKNLRIEHDRILHAIVLSQDLEVFTHLHPEDFGYVSPEMVERGVFDLRYKFPTEGRYLIAVDFTSKAETYETPFFVTVGEAFSMTGAVMNFEKAKNVDGIDVRLSSPVLHANSLERLSFSFERNGEPLTTLSPYLAAPMHFSVVKRDLRTFTHAHALLPDERTALQKFFWPEVRSLKHLHMRLPSTFGPILHADIQFPSPGAYALFGEFVHGGKKHLVRFDVRVEPEVP